MKKLTLGLLLALPAALYGCGNEYPDTISRERFVKANVALRRLEAPGGDSLRTAADSARARAAVLKKQGVTEKQLQAWVDARRNDTEELSETWREIATGLTRADSTARADSIRKDSLARKDSIRKDSLARKDTVAKDSVARPAPAPVSPPPGGAGVAPPPPGVTPQARPASPAREKTKA